MDKDGEIFGGTFAAILVLFFISAIGFHFGYVQAEHDLAFKQLKWTTGEKQ